MEQDLFPEIALPDILGIDRKGLREFRRNILDEGQDWLKQGTTIYLTREGLHNIFTFMEIADDNWPELERRILADQTLIDKRIADVELEVCWVAKGPHQNKRIIYARGDDGKEVTVRVNARESFTEGMIIKCKATQDPTVYELAQRQPRTRRGR